MKKIIFTFSFFVFAFILSSSAVAQTAYWTEGFEDAAVWPSSATTTPTTFVATSGTWTLYGCYRTTSTSGKPVGTADLRLPKPASGPGPFNYIITPQLANGVGIVSLVEGRASSTPVTIEKSTDNGTTWTVVGTVQTTANATPATITVNDAQANKIRFSNQTTGTGKDEDLDELSVTSYTGTAVGEEVGIPNNYSLAQNYPNPFNPSTKISFELPKEGFTTLSVFNVLGQKVANLVNKNLQAGSHEFTFDASELNSGVYLYKLESGNFVKTMKMLLIK
jgi:hypothetical protein